MLPNEHLQICWENMYLSMKSNGNPKPDQLGLDIDLIDIITTVITELKANDDGHSIQKKRYAKFPCARCDKNCNANQQAIFFTSCSNWVH